MCRHDCCLYGNEAHFHGNLLDYITHYWVTSVLLSAHTLTPLQHLTPELIQKKTSLLHRSPSERTSGKFRFHASHSKAQETRMNELIRLSI